MLIKELKKRKRVLDNLIPQLKSWLSKAPRETLRISGKYCFIMKNKNDTTGRRTKDARTIHILATKQYYRKVLRSAETELKQIDKLLETETEHSIANIYSNMSKTRKDLVKPLETTINEQIQSWLSNNEASLPIKPGSYAVMTKRGDLVRSKAEMMIADALFDSNIPYKTDVEFAVDNFRSYWVDFEIINPNTGEKYYWEHLGMMDKADYVNKNIGKLEYYASKGVYPGKNLILTFEDGDHKIDGRHIQRIIRDLLK